MRGFHISFYLSKIKLLETNENLENANNKLNQLNNDLELLSTTDSLTKVANRRAFDTYVEKSWKECVRTLQPMTIMMFDIDNFKMYNDFYGHLQGDICLQKLQHV